MDVAKLNRKILGVDLEYKNVYIDAENTRMIRAKLPYGYCDLVRTDVWNGRVNHPEEHDIVKYTAISWYREEFGYCRWLLCKSFCRISRSGIE